MAVQKRLIRLNKNKSSEAIDKTRRKSTQWDIVGMRFCGVSTFKVLEI
jgi:hypothetical protein